MRGYIRIARDESGDDQLSGFAFDVGLPDSHNLKGDHVADKADAKTYERASDYVKGIGESLEKIAGTDVLLHSYEVSERSMRGEQRTFVSMMISTVSDPDNPQMFHAWSDSLAEKLGDLPQDRLPVLIAFERVATSGGFRVWSFK